MTHCELRGSQIILGSESHIGSTEHGHVARIAGVFPRMFLEKDDGTLPLSDLEDVILTPVPANVCKTRLICLENTHNRCGGKILPLDYLKQVYSLAQENNIKVHVDGARLMNAAVGLGVDVKEITQYCDSITFCLNKGIGAPVGCIVAGNEPFINRCWEHCKTLGGQMFQFGMLNFSSPAVTVNPEEVETNIVFLRTHRDHSFVKELFKRLMMCPETELAELGKEIHVTCVIMGKRIRLVTHFSITEQDIEDAIKKISYVMKEYQQL
ncbi:probable low-specificity L-threonine aldolase 2 [Argonauta hians]